MSSVRDRQRAAARARLEREWAEKAEAARHKRQNRLKVTAAAAGVIVVVAAVWVILANTGDDSTEQPAANTTYPCVWTPLIDPSASPQPTAMPKEIKDVGTPPTTVSAIGTQTGTMTTSQGVIKFTLDTSKAPCTSASLTYLADKKFYDKTECHRLVTGVPQVLQCGDPIATGTGGPSYRFGEENLPTGRPLYPAGTVAMAKGQDPGTTGSQFFIVWKDIDRLDQSTGTLGLNPDYTVVGHVTEGMDVVNKIAAAGVEKGADGSTEDGKPKLKVTIESMTITPAQQP